MTVLMVSLAGAVGAVCRYLISGWVQGALRTGFPVGTTVVNLSGAFALGLVVGAGSPDSSVTMILAGFLGGFTTFSTWMVETLALRIPGRRALREAPRRGWCWSSGM